MGRHSRGIGADLILALVIVAFLLGFAAFLVYG